MPVKKTEDRRCAFDHIPENPLVTFYDIIAHETPLTKSIVTGNYNIKKFSITCFFCSNIIIQQPAGKIPYSILHIITDTVYVKSPTASEFEIKFISNSPLSFL